MCAAVCAAVWRPVVVVAWCVGAGWCAAGVLPLAHTSFRWVCWRWWLGGIPLFGGAVVYLFSAGAVVLGGCIGFCIGVLLGVCTAGGTRCAAGWRLGGWVLQPLASFRYVLVVCSLCIVMYIVLCIVIASYRFSYRFSYLLV